MCLQLVKVIFNFVTYLTLILISYFSTYVYIIIYPLSLAYIKKITQCNKKELVNLIVYILIILNYFS